MLLVKVLLLLVGSGSVAGVTYSQIQKDPDAKTVVVSNNHESKIRAIFEQKLDTDLLKSKMKRLTNTTTENTKIVKEKSDALEAAKKELIQAQEDLNTAKSELNAIATTIITKYGELTTKNNDIKTKLEAKMSDDLDKETKKLKKEFYDFQKSTYEKEREAISNKIKKIDPSNTSTSDSFCSGTTHNWNPSTIGTTTEETQIHNQIQTELGLICKGINDAETESSTNTPTNDKSKEEDYKTAENTRNSTISEIKNKTNEYNSKVIDIKSKESSVKFKLLAFQHAQSYYQSAKERLDKAKNELEIVGEKIANK